MKTSYNEETKEVTSTSSVEEFRCIALGMALGMGGPGLANHLIQGLIDAADNTSNDEDFKVQVEAFFDHVRDEHTTNDGQKQIVEILRTMATALPRRIVMEEHYRQMGKQDSAGASESFQA